MNAMLTNDQQIVTIKAKIDHCTFQVRSIHQSINLTTASVELRRENGRSAGKLTPVKLVQKSGKLKGEVYL